MKLKVKSLKGKSSGTVELDDSICGVEPNVALMHQVVNAQLAARRRGTASTKTRAEVRGGGAKPWRQKGTGRARAGSSRSPIWVGGGQAHGPKPRSYAERTNKKMIKGSLYSAISDRAKDEKIVVVDSWDFDKPNTKSAVSALDSIGVTGKVLVVIGREENNAVLSFRNLEYVKTITSDQLNTFDVLVCDYLVFSKDTLEQLNNTKAGVKA